MMFRCLCSSLLPHMIGSDLQVKISDVEQLKDLMDQGEYDSYVSEL